MDILNIFKSKEQKAIEELNKLIFPNGQEDIHRDASRIYNILQGKMNIDECKALIKNIKALLVIADDKSDERIVSSIMRRRMSNITLDDAYSIYAYLSGEATHLDNMRRSLGKKLPLEIIEEIALSYKNGVTTEMLPNGYGEYGITPTNPILTTSSIASENYLKRLLFNGQSVEYERIGIIPSKVTTMIDIYKILLNYTELIKVYISPYHKKNSKRPPSGFTFVAQELTY